MIVPEPEAKARLRGRGIAIPNGVVLDADGAGTGVDGLCAPLVLKAFGSPYVLSYS